MVSTYIDFKTKLEDNSIFNIFQDIKNGKYESEINSIRYAMHSGKEKLADELKSKLKETEKVLEELQEKNKTKLSKENLEKISTIINSITT